MAETTLTLPKAVIFDWDNTLIDNWGSIAAALNVTFLAFGKEQWTREQVLQRATRALRDSFPEWFGDDWRRAHDIFYDHFRTIHMDHIRVLPGAGDLLEWFQDRRIPQFVVSNKRGDMLRTEVKALNWDGFFMRVVGSTDAPRDKPMRDPVDLVLSGTALKADDPGIWFIGDTYIDMECARNAGCTPVLLHHNAAQAEKLKVTLAFSDCQALQSLLYNLADNNKKPA